MKLLEHRFGYGLSIFILIVSVLAMWLAREFQSVSAWFPLFVSAAAAALALVVIAADVMADRRAPHVTAVVAATVPADAGLSLPGDVAAALPDDGESEEDDTPPAVVLFAFAKYVSWFIGFAVLFLLVGMPLSVFLWVLGFIRFASRESWRRAGISAVALTLGLIVLAAILGLGLPEGWLLDSNVIIPNWRI